MQQMIMNYDRSYLYAPNGDLVWEGHHQNRLEALEGNQSYFGQAHETLASLCGSATRSDGSPWVNQTDVRTTAEDLNFLSRDGCAPGFFVLLPAATKLDRAIEAFNSEYLNRRNAHEIDFPLVFDNRPEDTQSLTRKFETQSRMFKLNDQDEGLRLSYAADPGLFSWLRNKTLDDEKLPYTILSRTVALRRYPRGRLSSYQKSRQFKMSDMHTLTTDAQAHYDLTDLVALNSQTLDFWAGDNSAQFLDVTNEFFHKRSETLQALVKASGRFTLVNRLTDQPRYYSMRGGMMADGGTGAVMLHNIQWDAENAHRFNITTKTGEYPTVIHASALSGIWLLNTLIGRSLAGVSSKAIPPEVAISPIVLIPLRDEFTEVANLHAERLTNKGIPAAVESAGKRFQKTVWAQRKKWQPAFSVIGEKEVGCSNLVFSQGKDALQIDENAFFSENLNRIARCGGTHKFPAPELPF